MRHVETRPWGDTVLRPVTEEPPPVAGEAYVEADTGRPQRSLAHGGTRTPEPGYLTESRVHTPTHWSWARNSHAPRRASGKRHPLRQSGSLRGAVCRRRRVAYRLHPTGSVGVRGRDTRHTSVGHMTPAPCAPLSSTRVPGLVSTYPSPAPLPS